MSRAQPITPWGLFSTACQLTYGSQKRNYPISGHDCREPVAFIALRANGATVWRFTFDASKRGSRDRATFNSSRRKQAFAKIRKVCQYPGYRKFIGGTVF